jgi:sterol desaturase/sphingolipid hydroxylase (fatty acid hydroxylase superfamily)
MQQSRIRPRFPLNSSVRDYVWLVVVVIIVVIVIVVVLGIALAGVQLVELVEFVNPCEFLREGCVPHLMVLSFPCPRNLEDKYG